MDKHLRMLLDTGELSQRAAYVALSRENCLHSVKFLSPAPLSDFSSGDFLNIEENTDINHMAKTKAHSNSPSSVLNIRRGQNKRGKLILLFRYLEQNTLSAVVEFLWTTSMMVRFQDNQQDSWEKLTLRTANMPDKIQHSHEWRSTANSRDRHLRMLLDIGWT